MKESIKKIGKQMMVLVSIKPYQSPSLVSYQATWLFGPLWITIAKLRYCITLGCLSNHLFNIFQLYISNNRIERPKNFVRPDWLSSVCICNGQYPMVSRFMKFKM